MDSWRARQTGLPVPPEVMQPKPEVDDEDDDEDEDDEGEAKTTESEKKLPLKERFRRSFHKVARFILPEVKPAAAVTGPPEREDTPHEPASQLEPSEQPTPEWSGFEDIAEPAAVASPVETAEPSSQTTPEQPEPQGSEASSAPEPPTSERPAKPNEENRAPTDLPAPVWQPYQERHGAAAPAALHEQMAAETKTEAEKIVYPDKRGIRAAAGLFWIGQFLDIHRLHKRDRLIRAGEKRLESLEHHQGDVDRQRHRQEQVNYSFERRLGRVESPSYRPKVERVAASVPERPVTSYVTEHGPAVTGIEAIPHRPASELHPENYRQVVEHDTVSRPEMVLHEVETAAEQNIPIEGLYERRHEIKDEAVSQAGSSPLQYDGGRASHVSQVLQSPEFARTQRMPQLQTEDEQPATRLYSRAARTGVVTAIVLLALLLVAFFLH